MIAKQLLQAHTAQQLHSEEASIRYLLHLKWGNGFACRKCGHHEYVKGRKWYYRRCRSCFYDESVTVNTIFHKLKFPLRTALALYAEIHSSARNINAKRLAEKYGVHPNTVQHFCNRIRKYRQSQVRSGLDMQKDETKRNKLHF